MDEQVDYVQSLWDSIAATVDQVPLHEWQQALLRERLAAHQRAPEEARPWQEAIARVQAALRNDP